MNETPAPALDSAAFRQVWRRVMPEDRADCPFTLDPPAVPAVAPAAPPPPMPQTAPSLLTAPQMPTGARTMPQACLGESCRSVLPDLEQLLSQANDGARIYRALARRAGRTRSFLSSLAAAKDRQVRRLAAARFLILGETFPFPATVFPQTGSLPLALRERYQAEQRSALAFFTAAERAADPCLIQLYRELAAEDQRHAEQIRERLEGK